MPINMVIPVGSGTAVGTGVTTYSGLLTSAGLWLERSDLITMIPDFITLTEERLSRILRVPEMEEVATVTLTDGVGDLPTDLREIRHVYWNADTDSELVPVPLATLRRDYPLTSYAARPQVYAVRGGEIEVAPLPGSIEGELTLHYFQDIPAISSGSETNWLISKHPSLYLFGVLMHAEFFGWNDDRLPLIKSAWDEAIAELNAQGVSKRHGGGPLFPRPIPRPMGRS